MLKINIANTEFEYLNALETEEHFNGSFRRTLTVTCADNAIGIDELNALLVKENLYSIALINDEVGVTNYHDGYVMKLECGVKNVLLAAETPDADAVYVDRLIFKLGRPVYKEKVTDTAVAIAESAAAQATYTAMMTDTLLEV